MTSNPKPANVFAFPRGSAAGAYLAAFAQSLAEAGYVPSAVQRRVTAAAHLGYWADAERIELAALDEQALLAFGKHLRACRCIKRRRRRGRADPLDARLATLFVAHLRSLGIVPAAPPPEAIVVSPVLAAYRAWMLRHRGVTSSTIDVYQRVLVEVLATIGDDAARYTAPMLRKFILDRRDRGHGWIKTVATPMRSFLRYLAAEGRCVPGLDGAVPSAAQWRLSALPHALAPEAVGRLLATCDPAARCGLRDRAVLLLLARLGLRAGDVAQLRFDDVDWSEGTLRLRGKARRESLLPLPQDVGEALLAYVECGRPAHADARIFLTAIAPSRPIAASAISSIVGTSLRHAGITDAPSRGSHLMRHSAATAMLRGGASLDAIAGVLRHKSLQTTQVYAKVDLALLATVVQPWPGVVSCSETTEASSIVDLALLATVAQPWPGVVSC